jgi:hypothetical protein
MLYILPRGREGDLVRDDAFGGVRLQVYGVVHCKSFGYGAWHAGCPVLTAQEGAVCL